MKVKRGQIWWATFNDAVGHEQRGRRPVLILQNNVGNDKSSTTIVAAITYGRGKHQHTHVWMDAGEGGLEKESVVLLEQIRTIDKSRLTSLVGKLTLERMMRIDHHLKISLGLLNFEIKEERRNAKYR